MKPAETIHSENINNIKLLIDVCTVYEASYHKLDSIDLSKMNATWQKANIAMQALGDARQCHEQAVKDLLAAISLLRNRSGLATDELKESTPFNSKLQLIVDKINDNASRINTAALQGAEPGEEKVFVLLAMFHNLTLSLAACGYYKPADASICTDSMLELEMQTRQLLLDVKLTKIRLHNQCNTRNHLLYGGPDSLLKLSAEARRKIRTAFGAHSEQYMTIQKYRLQLRNIALRPTGYTMVS